MTIQPQYTLTGAGTSAFTNSAESTVNEEELPVDDLRDIVAKYERELSFKKPALEQYQSKEHDLESHSQGLYTTLQSMAKEDGRLRKAEKAARYLALPSPFTMGIGAVTHNPIVAACGAVMLLGAVALKVYSKKRIDEIDRTFNPMQNEYRQSAMDLNSARIQREKLGSEVSRLEADFEGMKKRVAQAEADMFRMAESLASEKPYGAGEVEDVGEFIIIDGLKVKKGCLQ